MNEQQKQLPPNWSVDTSDLPYELVKTIQWKGKTVLVRLSFELESQSAWRRAGRGAWSEERSIELYENGDWESQVPSMRFLLSNHFHEQEDGYFEDWNAVCKEADKVLARMVECHTCDTIVFKPFMVEGKTFCSQDCFNRWESAMEEEDNDEN